MPIDVFVSVVVLLVQNFVVGFITNDATGFWVGCTVNVDGFSPHGFITLKLIVNLLLVSPKPHEDFVKVWEMVVGNVAWLNIWEGLPSLTEKI